MKKILSLILAVIMLLSVMPVAYAERVTYAPEVEQYINYCVRLSALTDWSSYESNESLDEIIGMLKKDLEKLEFIDLNYNTLINVKNDGRLDELIALNECFDKFFDEIDKKIADGKLVCVVDTYEFYNLAMPLELNYYNDKDVDELMDRAEKFGSDTYMSAKNEFESALELRHTYRTQAEFDDALDMMKPFLYSVMACLDGNHPYGEYVSNNDATEEADGTKTATCEFCGATDTIVDEGTKIVKEEEPISFFEKLFALIKEFFAMIFSIFG